MNDAVKPTIREYWPRRYTVVALSCAAILICYLDRINISIAIIPMSEDLGWAPDKQGLALSSFFVGYLLTQILGGRLADKYGGKAILAIGVLVWSVATLFTPPAAAAGFGILIATRIAMGVGEGVAFPTIYSLYSRWLPPGERSRAIGLTYAAIPLGSVLALLVAPWIVVQYGWEWVFYSFAMTGLVWYFFWQRMVTSYPVTHPSISDDERAYITADAPPVGSADKLPWRALLSSTPVWAIIVAHFCANWGTYVLLAWLPTYVNRGLGVDFASVGLWSAIPYATAFASFSLSGVLADRLSAKGWDRTRLRKSMQVVGFGGPALMLLLVTFVDTAPAAISLMAMGNLFLGFSAGGFTVNHLDIAPRYAGILMGFSNTAGTIPGIIGVSVSGFILAQTGSWDIVFQTAAGVYLFGLVFYLVFASGKRIFD
jgi:MFS family permease